MQHAITGSQVVQYLQADLWPRSHPVILRRVISDPPEPVRLTVAAVAQQLGIAPGTLRTWDRRYGVGPSDHTAGRHRRYSAADLARLAEMRRLVLSGASPGDAAEHVLASPPSRVAEGRQFPDQRGRLPQRRGVQVPGVPGSDDLVRGLGRAALALDGDAVYDGVAGQLASYGVLQTWDAVVVPLLVTVGRHWAETGEGVDAEHLVSDSIVSALRQHAPRLPAPPRAPLLACAPGDLHALPLHALAAALAERGLGSRLLGASVPLAALQSAVRRTGPAAVFLWSQIRATGGAGTLLALPATRPATVLVAGGPGWPHDLPSTAVRADTLTDAVDLLGQATTGEALASSG